MANKKDLNQENSTEKEELEQSKEVVDTEKETLEETNNENKEWSDKDVDPDQDTSNNNEETLSAAEQQESVPEAPSPSYEVNERGEIVIDNTQSQSEITPPPTLDRTAKIKEPMDKKKKIMIISIAVAAVIVIFSAIFFPCFFYYRNKIMVASAEDFVAESGKYFYLKNDIYIDGDLDLSNSDCSISLNGHTLTVTGTLTMSSQTSGTISIGTKSGNSYINKGQLTVSNFVVDMPNATLNLATPVNISGSTTISSNTLNINGISVALSAVYSVNTLNINGNIVVSDENTTITFDNCGTVNINSSIGASVVEFTHSNAVESNTTLITKSGIAINNLVLDAYTDARIYSTVESIDGGNKVVMLPYHNCTTYSNIALLAIYKAYDDAFTTTNCDKVVYIDTLSTPIDAMVNETNGQFLLTIAQVEGATNYKVIINNDFDNPLYDNGDGEADGVLDITSILSAGGAATYYIQVYAIGNYSFETLDTVDSGDTAYIDAISPISIKYTYTLTLTTPSNVSMDNSNPTLRFDSVNYADYYIVTIDNETEIKCSLNGGDNILQLTLENNQLVADLTAYLGNLGYHSIRVAAYSNSAQINHSKEAMTSYKTTAQLEAPQATITYTRVSDTEYTVVVNITSSDENASIYKIDIDGTEIRTTEKTITITTSSIPTSVSITAEAHGFYTERTSTSDSGLIVIQEA